MIDDHRVDDRRVGLILAAISRSGSIEPAGPKSMVAIAARALEPQTPLSRSGLSSALGLHPAVVVSLFVAADRAGDTLSRRELAEKLFPRLPLRDQAPVLSPGGELELARWALGQLLARSGRLAGFAELAGRALECARQIQQGNPGGAGIIEVMAAAASAAQESPIVILAQGSRERPGLAPEIAAMRHGAQAVRALLQGLRDGGGGHLCTTVAGEVTGCLAGLEGVIGAGELCVELALFIDSRFRDGGRPTS